MTGGSIGSAIHFVGLYLTSSVPEVMATADAPDAVVGLIAIAGQALATVIGH